MSKWSFSWSLDNENSIEINVVDNGFVTKHDWLRLIEVINMMNPFKKDEVKIEFVNVISSFKRKEVQKEAKQDVRDFVKDKLEMGFYPRSICNMVKEKFERKISCQTIRNWRQKWEEQSSLSVAVNDQDGIKEESEEVVLPSTPIIDEQQTVIFPKEVYRSAKKYLTCLDKETPIIYENVEFIPTAENIAHVINKKFHLNGTLTAQQVTEWKYRLGKVKKGIVRVKRQGKEL